MELNTILDRLEEHNYKCQLKNNKIFVDLDYSQKVVIDLSSPSKIILLDYLENWNFLTGCIKMSLKNAMLYNFIGLLIFGFFCQYNQFSGLDLNSILLTFIGWVVLFSIYYLIKLESFKLQFLAITK